MLFLFIVLMIISTVSADSMVMFEFPGGSAVAMTSSGDISMAAESVFITPADGVFSCYDDNWGLPMMEVRCVFELVNNTQEEQFITAGFPIDAKFGDSYTALGDSELVSMLDSMWTDEERPSWLQISPTDGLDASHAIPDSLNFSTRVNGEEIPVYYRTCAYSLEENLIWEPVAAVWQMSFMPEETVLLENTYRTSWDYYGGGPWSDYSVDYVLTTGGTWSGPIGDAVIILTVPEALPEPSLTDTLAVYWDWEGSPVIEGRTVTWHLSDFDPEENIRFSVNTENRLNYWDYRIDAQELFNEVSWTEDDLLRTAGEYLETSLVWNPRFDSILLLRVLGAVPFIMNGFSPMNGVPTQQFNMPETGSIGMQTAEQLAALGVVETVGEGVEENIDLVRDAGYFEFLPVFSVRYQWDESHLNMYSAMPEKEEKFLDLLEHLEAARAGESIDLPAVRAFFELTGWYHRGYESMLPTVPADIVAGYREMVESNGS